jgi:molybdenum cofactor guanylyltransferase
VKRGAIVLAGGASRRMGQAKAWLPVDGESLLERVCRVVGAVCPELVIATRDEQTLPWVGRAHRVTDAPGAPGPLAGVAAGLAALANREVMVAYLSGCDAVGLESTHVEFMLSALEQGGPEIDAVVPRATNSSVEPLGAAVRVRPALTAVHRLMAQGERRLSCLFSQLHAHAVPLAQCPAPNALASCNTPEELERYLRSSFFRIWGARDSMASS